MGEEVKLIGARGSPFNCRVEIALKLKGVEYEFIEEDLANKSPLLLKYNPVHKKIPVLLHNGKPIAESLVILEYVDQTWEGASILPQHPYERAMARFWAKFIDDKCMSALWNACWSKGKEQEKAIEEANELLKLLENELKDKKFFGGDNIGLVDIVADFIAYWVGAIQEVTGAEVLTKEKFPKLFEWAREFINCSIVKEKLPPRDHLTGFFRIKLEAPDTLKYNPQVR
ncbi:hypothetical protein LguiA_016307 [Lonicera macranthoides]